ncbi:MAG: LysM domain-containing protein [Burkholderiales bacterium]|nr:MAG: LysM domain-containing protein [Burkholderiales bacterium]
MPSKTASSAAVSLAPALRPAACAALLLAGAVATTALAQTFPNLPITPQQRAIANQVAEAGVPLSELAPNAPSQYTVKRGDTLWGISGVFLLRPWRWPELWGMNLQDIRNPHLIFPGQVLYLDTSNGRAVLTTRRPDGGLETVKISPRIRSESLADSAIPPISLQAIESFLTEPLVVDEATFSRAPRIVATPESRVLLSRGDRAYARALYGSGQAEGAKPLRVADGHQYRVFRNAVPLKDPETGEILGYEAQYVGKAELVRDEGLREVAAAPEGRSSSRAPEAEIVPATIDITQAKEEMRVGDRLLPEPPRDFSNYVPSAPGSEISGSVVKVYGNAVTFAGQNQVVAINRGGSHGVERGHVFALQRETGRVADRTDDSRPMMRLPGERNGLMMVFRTFDKVSYALVLEIGDGVKVGDRFTNP